jgi:hypothetical protein
VDELIVTDAVFVTMAADLGGPGNTAPAEAMRIRATGSRPSGQRRKSARHRDDQARLRAAAGRTLDGSWVTGGGYTEYKLRENRHRPATSWTRPCRTVRP